MCIYILQTSILRSPKLKKKTHTKYPDHVKRNIETGHVHEHDRHNNQKLMNLQVSSFTHNQNISLC